MTTLPTLDAEVPVQLRLAGGQRRAVRLAHLLIDAGVIGDVVTARHARDPLRTCELFLQRWLAAALPALRCLNLHFRLVMDDHADAQARDTSAHAGTIYWSTELAVFTVGPALTRLEAIARGLGATVLTVIDRCSPRLLPAFTPCDLRAVASEHYWYGFDDETEALLEADADERAAMQEGMVTRAKLDATYPAWALEWPDRRKTLPERRLESLAERAVSPRVRAVVAATLALARSRVTNDAYAADADGCFVGFGPILAWGDDDDLTTRVFDDYANDAVQGDSVDWFGECDVGFEDAAGLQRWMDVMATRFSGIRALDGLIHELVTGDWSRVPKGIR